jgi:hypothetical protein
VNEYVYECSNSKPLKVSDFQYVFGLEVEKKLASGVNLLNIRDDWNQTNV